MSHTLYHYQASFILSFHPFIHPSKHLFPYLKWLMILHWSMLWIFFPHSISATIVAFSWYPLECEIFLLCLCVYWRWSLYIEPEGWEACSQGRLLDRSSRYCWFPGPVGFCRQVCTLAQLMLDPYYRTLAQRLVGPKPGLPIWQCILVCPICFVGWYFTLKFKNIPKIRTKYRKKCSQRPPCSDARTSPASLNILLRLFFPRLQRVRLLNQTTSFCVLVIVISIFFSIVRPPPPFAQGHNPPPIGALCPRGWRCWWRRIGSAAATSSATAVATTSPGGALRALPVEVGVVCWLAKR